MKSIGEIFFACNENDPADRERKQNSVRRAQRVYKAFPDAGDSFRKFLREPLVRRFFNGEFGTLDPLKRNELVKSAELRIYFLRALMNEILDPAPDESPVVYPNGGIEENLLAYADEIGLDAAFSRAAVDRFKQKVRQIPMRQKLRIIDGGVKSPRLC